jgi:hypothetical protein
MAVAALLCALTPLPNEVIQLRRAMPLHESVDVFIARPW